MGRDRRDKFRYARTPGDWAPRRAHESAAIRVEDDIRCKDGFQCRDFTCLGGSDEGGQKAPLLGGTHRRTPPLGDMCSSAPEAEDVVQDAWLRWQTTDRSVVRDAPAFLATLATRLAINVAQSARSRRETYVGPWLPD